MPEQAPDQPDAAFFEEAVCSCKAPEWILTEEWATLGEDGEITALPSGTTRAAAERYLQHRRADIPGRQSEPGARLMSRLRIVGVRVGRVQVTAWIGRDTPGDPPSPVPAFLRGGFTC